MHYVPAAGKPRRRSRRGTVSSATDFQLDRFADCLLEIGLTGVAASEEDGGRPLRLPRLDLTAVPCRVHVDFDVRISPIELGKRTRQSDAVVEIEYAGHVVMRRRGYRQQRNAKHNENTDSNDHRKLPS